MPSISRYDAVAHANTGKIKDGEARERAEKFFERLNKNSVTYWVREQNVYSKSEMMNVWLSLCYTCGAFAVWVEDKIVYPIINSEIMPHEDMPGDVRDDFNEAALIVDQSPRGAAALLRLAIQKLMPHLKQKGKDLNAEMIGTRRSRVSFFMNKFRKLGYIEYNGKLEIRNSLLNVILYDKPEIRKDDTSNGPR
jgi:hypothetical protein